MTRMMMIGLGLTLVVGACGGSVEDPVDTEDSKDVEAVDAAPAPSETAVPVTEAQTEPDDEPVPAEPVTSGTGDDDVEAVGGEDTVPDPAVTHPNPNVASAMADLVERIGADPSSVVVKSVEEVTWPDGSLGCPLPDMRYTQALVNGTRTILEVDGAQYAYHSGGGRDPFYCKNPSDPVPGDYGDA